MNERSKPRLVVFLVSPGVNMIDLGGPMQVFSTCNDLSHTGQIYRITTASAHGGDLRTSPGLLIPTVPITSIDAADIDTLIVPGGSDGGKPPTDSDTSEWIASHAAKIRRICSICTGAFLLGPAGLLAGRRVATHWRWRDELQRLNPDAKVELDPIYIEHNRVWTSAGVTAGIDLSLALISRDEGRAIAMAVARNLVVYITRSGGQAQFSIPLEAQSAHDSAFTSLNDWILQNLAVPHDIAGLADMAKMSERTFRRKYREATGKTPMQAVELFRLEAASQAIATTSRSIKQIARMVGCETESNLLRLFRRHYGITPSAFRERFSQSFAPHANEETRSFTEKPLLSQTRSVR